ncbi:MAG: hypothetical protein K5769_06840 [Pseudobutyrivibrio sp.]|nr:hypothetical protein [Pseudobutyrivibrio sp.]
MNFNSFKNKTLILVFVCILALPWIVGGGMRLFAPKLFKKLTVVETEKRQLNKIEWSNLLNTGESISDFVDDRIPFRYSLISLYKNMNDKTEGQYQKAATAIGQKIYSANKGKDKEQEANQPIAPEDAAAGEQAAQEQLPDNYFPLQTYEDVIIARDGWLFLYGEHEIECYQGTNLLSQEDLANYAAKLNALQDLCDAQGKQLYIYIAPNKSQVYSKYMPTVDIVNTVKRAQQLHSYMAENCRTPFIYPLTECLNAAGIVQTYYKYDSHWNHIGALYGTNALYAAMGAEQTNPMDWNVGTQDADKYELYTYMGIPDDMVTHDDQECTIDYRPNVTVNGLDPEAMICRTTSDGMYDRRICMIGDSFRVNMMPYIAKDFTNCTFAHRDHMKEVYDDIKASDTIIIEAVERYDYEAFNTIQRVTNVLSQ